MFNPFHGRSVLFSGETLRFNLLLDLGLILLQLKLKVDVLELAGQIFIQSLNLDAVLNSELFLSFEDVGLVFEELLA